MYHGFGARKHVNNLKNKEPTTFQRLEMSPQFVSLTETVNTECSHNKLGIPSSATSRNNRMPSAIAEKRSHQKQQK